MWNHHRTDPGRPPRRPRVGHRSAAALHALHQRDVLHLQRPAEHHPLQGNPVCEPSEVFLKKSFKQIEAIFDICFADVVFFCQGAFSLFTVYV